MNEFCRGSSLKLEAAIVFACFRRLTFFIGMDRTTDS